MLGALGNLQFEVLQYRLRDEYNVETNLEIMPWKIMRWLKSPMDKDILKKKLSYNGITGVDDRKKQVILSESIWNVNSFEEKNPEIELLDFLID